MLLPIPKQETTNAEEALRISRIKDLREQEEQLRLSNARIESEFLTTRAERLKEWEKEWEDHQNAMAEWKRQEEEERVKYLSIAVPFDILKQGAEDKMQIARDMMEGVKQRELHNENLKEQLEEKLSEVEEREDALSIREQKVVLTEKSSSERSRQTQEAQENLSLAVIQFNKDSLEKRTELNKRETEITLKEKSLDSREQGLAGKERDLNQREIRLADERDVLQKAWNELSNRSPS